VKVVKWWIIIRLGVGDGCVWVVFLCCCVLRDRAGERGMIFTQEHPLGICSFILPKEKQGRCGAGRAVGRVSI